jgi:glycosyltransferase involved in cell wall biosynthesis
VHILHVTRETGSDARYGIRKSLLPVLAALRKRGHEVELFDQERANGMPLHPVARTVERMYFKYLKFRYGAQHDLYVQIARERVMVSWSATLHARRVGATHVHLHDPLLAHAFTFFAHMFGLRARWGYSQHAFGRYVQPRLGIAPPQHVLRHLGTWEEAAERAAHWVVVPSQAGMEQQALDLGLSKPSSHWHLVPHPRPTVLPGTGDGIRAQFGIGNDCLVLAVGQLIPMKRFHLLIEALSLLPGSKLPHLMILGEGEQELRLKELAAERGLSERFHIAITDDIAPFLRAADVYVSVSSTESYGMANCEALAAGLPAVCTPVGAVPEVMGNGALFTGESPGEIASTLVRLLDSPSERTALSEKARVRAAQWWDADRVALHLESIYKTAGGR